MRGSWSTSSTRNGVRDCAATFHHGTALLIGTYQLTRQPIPISSCDFSVVQLHGLIFSEESDPLPDSLMINFNLPHVWVQTFGDCSETVISLWQDNGQMAAARIIGVDDREQYWFPEGADLNYMNKRMLRDGQFNPGLVLNCGIEGQARAHIRDRLVTFDFDQESGEAPTSLFMGRPVQVANGELIHAHDLADVKAAFLGFINDPERREQMINKFAGALPRLREYLHDNWGVWTISMLIESLEEFHKDVWINPRPNLYIGLMYCDGEKSSDTPPPDREHPPSLSLRSTDETKSPRRAVRISGRRRSKRGNRRRSRHRSKRRSRRRSRHRSRRRSRHRSKRGRSKRRSKRGVGARQKSSTTIDCV